MTRVDALSEVAEEAEVVALLDSLSRRFQPATVAFVGVRVVSPSDSSVHPDQTVIVRDGRFVAVGPSPQVPVPPGAWVVRGEGRWLVPGLTDMHVHSLVSNSQKLLHLINGVTTVRDMDGFPHLLAERRAIASHRLLGPSMLVAGTILNAVPMESYARVVTSPEEARAAVGEQKRAGYDFIKVHNVMPLDLYRVILEEAHRESLDVVGHVPHQVSLADAIALGQRTLEHFKGYFLDRTLTMTDEDYVGLTRGANVWLCPTLYAVRSGISRSELEDLIARSEEMRYVPASRKRRWLAQAKESRDQSSEKIRTMSETIFRNLLAIHARFLTGTDSGGGYDNHVPGFSLQHELELMAALGMTPAQVLRASTTEAAAATRRETEFGAIVPGLRADAVLVDGDPLRSLAPLRSPKGVLVNGAWLPEPALDGIRTRLASIYAAPPPTSETAALDLLDRTASRFAGFQSRGVPALVAREGCIDTLANLLVDARRPRVAIKLLERNLADFPQSVGTHAALARAWLAAGDRNRARRYSEQTLDLDSFDPVARAVLQSTGAPDRPADVRGEYRFEIRALVGGKAFQSVPVTLTISHPESAQVGSMKVATRPEQRVTQATVLGDRSWLTADFPAGAIEFALSGRGATRHGAWRADWGSGRFEASVHQNSTH